MHRFLNFVYAWCLKMIDPAKTPREEWDRMLTDPLPGEEKAPPTPQQIEDEGAEFMALMGGGMPGVGTQ